MAALDLEMFTNGARNPQQAQEEIATALQNVTTAFRKNKLYPSLAEMIDLASSLDQIRTNRSHYQGSVQRRLTGVDLENKKLLFDQTSTDAESIRQIFELVDWAYPYLKSVTEEGITMFDFVTQNLSVNVVGIMPIYRDEGYAIIPDHRSDLLHVLRYEMSLYTADGDRYRALKTIELESSKLSAQPESPEDIKDLLVRDHKDLPNPATYYMDTDLDFPFVETILPVAKRKLMQELIS